MAASAATEDGEAEPERQERQTALKVLKVPAQQTKTLTAWRASFSDTPRGWRIQTPFKQD